MPELNDQQLDHLLGDCLKVSLDPQQGRAEAFFRRHLRGQAGFAWKQRAWLMGAFAGGLAASVAALWAAPWFRAVDRDTRRSAVSQTSSQLISPAVQRVVNSQTVDEGVLVLDDNTPVRVLRHRAVERTRWFNEDEKVKREQVTPRDDFVFIKLTTN